MNDIIYNCPFCGKEGMQGLEKLKKHFDVCPDFDKPKQCEEIVCPHCQHKGDAEYIDWNMICQNCDHRYAVYVNYKTTKELRRPSVYDDCQCESCRY